MEIKITLPIALLKAACLVAPNDSLNYESVAIDKGYLVATDRVLLFWAPLENIDPEIRIVIPRIHVECFIKKAERFSGEICDFIFNTKTQLGTLIIPKCVGCFENFEQVFNVYPDWQKAIPDLSKQDLTGIPYFDPNYLTKLESIAQILGTICSPKITPTGIDKGALIDFIFSEFDNVQACLMPKDKTYTKTKFCVEFNEEGDSPEWEQVPAESAEIALRAVLRMRKDLTNGQKSYFSLGRWFRPAFWQGSDEEHTAKMFYTEEWFKKPMKRFNNPQKAIEYIQLMNECVECFSGDSSITAYTIEEVNNFFAQNVELKDA